MSLCRPNDQLPELEIEIAAGKLSDLISSFPHFQRLKAVAFGNREERRQNILTKY